MNVSRVQPDASQVDFVTSEWVAPRHVGLPDVSMPRQRERAQRTPSMSVIIPVRNKEVALSRSLEALTVGAHLDLEVIVVCNGCTDETASVARAAEIGALVVELSEPSRTAAVRTGYSLASAYPRIHLEADDEMSAASLQALREPILAGEVLATEPRRVIPRRGSSVFVRWYYDVWERLPQARSRPLGRGVVVLSEEGLARVSALRETSDDDLELSEVFDESERMVVDEAVVVVRPPRTVADLLHRLARAAAADDPADDRGESTIPLRALAHLGLVRPWLAPKIAVFLGASVLARLRARRPAASGDAAAVVSPAT